MMTCMKMISLDFHLVTISYRFTRPKKTQVSSLVGQEIIMVLEPQMVQINHSW